jgi:hypothetical protein
MTQQEFEQLPKQVQRLRWDLFLITDGYAIDPTTDKNQERRNKTLNIINKLEQLKRIQ